MKTFDQIVKEEIHTWITCFTVQDGPDGNVDHAIGLITRTILRDNGPLAEKVRATLKDHYSRIFS